MDELAIIDYIRNKFNKMTLFDLKDDVAYATDDEVLKVDMLVGSTDIPPTMTAWQIGRKAVVSSVSDFASKGIRPLGMLLSLGLPKDYSDVQIRGIIDGFKLASDEFKIDLWGGDINESSDLIIDCFLYGKSDNKVGRNGATIGDLILTTGEFGLTKAGLDHLMLNAPLSELIRDRCLKEVLSPVPPLDFGVKAVEAHLFSSSMDSSDGLAFTLNEMSEQSKKKFVLERLPITAPTKNGLIESGRNYFDDVLFGGEEYQIAFTCKPEALFELESLAHSSGIDITVIGSVKEGKGVFIAEDAEEIKVRKNGWIHFKS